MNREQYERDLAERQRRHMESLSRAEYRNWKPCAHDQCQSCHGTGLGMFGPCVHSLYCDCPKCSPQSLSMTAAPKGGA